MRISAIVIKLRLADTIFGNYIGGAAEYAMTQKYPVKKQMAFVVPLFDQATANQDIQINQLITERFGVIVALKNDMQQSAKYGVIGYERIHSIRNQLFTALLEWQLPDTEDFISYNSSRLLDINPTWIWYQFDFQYTARITSSNSTFGGELEKKTSETMTEKIWEIAEWLSKKEAGEKGDDKYTGKTVEQLLAEIPPADVARDFNTIYMNVIMDKLKLPYTETSNLPVNDNYPDVILPDMALWLDMTDNPDGGGFGKGFHIGFDVDKR